MPVRIEKAMPFQAYIIKWSFFEEGPEGQGGPHERLEDQAHVRWECKYAIATEGSAVHFVPGGNYGPMACFDEPNIQKYQSPRRVGKRPNGV